MNALTPSANRLDRQGELADRLLAGDRRALAQAITLVECGHPGGRAVVREASRQAGKAWLIGVTGPPGAGKSTLVGALTTVERARGRSVAILAVDPSSPLTTGALLGDRIRLANHFVDPKVFIRSMANRGALGGLGAASFQAALLMDAAGHDVVLLETVGVGQSETEIVHQADTVVLVLMPGCGDSVQALKAGVMEIPDVIVVNKADHPEARTMVRQVKQVLSLSPSAAWQIPIVSTEASRGLGVEDLHDRIGEHRAYLEREGRLAERRRRNLVAEVLAIATSRVRRELEGRLADDPTVSDLLDRVTRRELDPATAAALIVDAVGNPSTTPRAS